MSEQHPKSQNTPPPAPADGPFRRARAEMRQVVRVVRERGPSKIQFWFIALFTGIAAGLAASAFRVAVSFLQTTLYGAESVETIHSFARTLPWYWVLAMPIMGGLLVGVILHRYTPDGRVRAVADVIEGAALNNGRVERRAGIASAMASLITLSSGGSTGREGPVVHIAGLISTWVSNRLNANGITGRDLLGCAVAAAVSASFNAPLAGALFALEVVLRHFAVHAFAPIAIASVAGAVVSRLEFGDVAQFSARGGGDGLGFYVELPAFLMLGLICGLVAVVLMRSIFWADDWGSQVQARIGLPRWIRPALAGGMLGAIAIWYPHIIGVGYETTSQALEGGLLLHEALVFVVIKVIAVVITMAGRMGGGVFSPSLMIGALTGLGFGLLATAVFPSVSSGGGLYALAGMGAVAAAVLGAPISTTLIVFELTGDWQTGLAVMVAVSASTAVASRIVDRSFFLTQLEKRGSRIAAGPQQYLLGLYSAAYIMRSLDSPRAAPEPRCRAMIESGIWIAPDTTLETLLPMLEESDDGFIPVLAPANTGGQGELMGAVFHVDALRAYNRALAETAAEEHS